MKTISIILALSVLCVVSSRRHHRYHHKDDNIVDHQKCKKCEEFGHSSPRLWNNILFCGDKNEPQHHLEHSDEECCLVAPGQCGKAFKDSTIFGVQFHRLKKKQEEEAPECMFCVHHTCNMTKFDEKSKVKCIISLYLCAKQADKAEIFKWINDFDRQYDAFVNSDRKKRLRLAHRHH